MMGAMMGAVTVTGRDDGRDDGRGNGNGVRVRELARPRFAASGRRVGPPPRFGVAVLDSDRGFTCVAIRGLPFVQRSTSSRRNLNEHDSCPVSPVEGPSLPEVQAFRCSFSLRLRSPNPCPARLAPGMPHALAERAGLRSCLREREIERLRLRLGD